MQRHPVNSSQIAAVGYDPATKKLHVEFKSHSEKPNSVYEYENVEPQHHKDLVESKSVGSHFHQKIRGKFKAVKVS